MPATTTADYDAFASVYDEWQERYGAFWRVVLPRLEATLARASLSGPPSFLDLGCGTGALAVALTSSQKRSQASLVEVSAMARPG